MFGSAMKMRISHQCWGSFLPGLAIFTFLNSCAASDQPATSSPPELVRRVVQNEITKSSGSSTGFMYKDQRKTPHVSQTKLMVETRDATAGLLVEQGGHPLTPEQQKAEKARLQNYINNPGELNKKRRQEKEDAERTAKIVKALPDAFLYEADGTERGADGVGQPGHELIRLKFRPNPSYDPPSRVEQVLTGMQGHLLIDAKENRIAEIDGTLQKEVGFGWGILGHLDRGGRFLVQQGDVGNQQWEVTRMELSFTGKVFFLKKLSIRSSDVFTEFRPVPANLTFAQGVELLEKEIAEHQSAGATKEHQQKTYKTKEQQTKEQAEEHVCCDR
jgi:hypothetical protein